MKKWDQITIRKVHRQYLWKQNQHTEVQITERERPKDKEGSKLLDIERNVCQRVIKSRKAKKGRLNFYEKEPH